MDLAGGQEDEELKDPNDKTGDQNHSIHQDCSIVSVEVARRCKFQLMASVYYLFNFHMRKLERKAENFAGYRTDK